MSVLQLDTHDLVSYIMANVIEKLETYIATFGGKNINDAL